MLYIFQIIMIYYNQFEITLCRLSAAIRRHSPAEAPSCRQGSSTTRVSYNIS